MSAPGPESGLESRPVSAPESDPQSGPAPHPAVETYLAALPPDQQAALRRLRATLARLLPGHAEVMSYGMPGFRKPGPEGRMVAGYAAFARHLGFYPHSGTVIPALDCRPFRTSKSGVLFTPYAPLPDSLVEAIVAARQAEIAAKGR